MRADLRPGIAVAAGLAWLFVARLCTDLLAPHALTPLWIVPPVVVFSLLLPRRAALICLAIVCLMHDATLAIPYGLSATLALPVAAMLHRIRRHVNTHSRRQIAALAFAITPTLHLAFVLAITLAGWPLPADLHGLMLEMAIGTVASALASPWLADFTSALLRLVGVVADDSECSA